MSTQQQQKQQQNLGKEGKEAQSQLKKGGVEDQQMRDDTRGAGSVEEYKQRSPFDLFKEFDQWSKSIFEDYDKIDKDMDRRFKEFQESMFKNQQKQIEEFKREMQRRPQLQQDQQRAISGGQGVGTVATRPEEGQLSNLTHHSYTKENRKMETRALQIGQYRILYKLIDQTRERDGLVFPHVVHQIECHPATPMDILMQNALFDEELDVGKKNKILSQFETDTKNVQDFQKPVKILKYVNSIVQEDPNNKDSGKLFTLKVVYLNKDNDRLKYYYRKRQGDANPQINIERSTSTRFFSSFW